MKNRFKASLFLIILTFGLLSFSMHPLVSVQAQVDASITANDLSSEIDTATSIFPTVTYEMVEADTPSEEIVIDESTLYSEEYYDLSEYYDEIVNQGEIAYDYMPKDYIRDITTHVGMYIYYPDTQTVQVLAPINIGDSLLEMYSVDQLINALYLDINFKNQRSYHYVLTDDLYDSYQLATFCTPEMMADMKANLMRAEALYQELDESDASYYLATETMDKIYEEYASFERRYNKLMADSTEVESGYSEEAEQDELAQDNLATVEEAIAVLPDTLLERLGYVGVVANHELPPSWNGTPIDAYAKTSLEMFFADNGNISPGLVFHELGHIVDFSSIIYDDLNYEGFESFSFSDEWQEVFEEEWASEGSYYNDLQESFAQAFGSYAIEYYLDTTMEEDGYPEDGIEDRPLSREYFDRLFTELEL